jgi:hypothetical protein
VDALGAAVAHQVEVLELDGAALLDDRHRRPPDGLHPVGELLGVGDGGGQAHEVDLGRGVDDDLLPHRAPVGVLEVVDLVEHHVAQPVEGRRAGVDHVAEDLGGHHDDGGVAVDGVVAGEEAHGPRPVRPHQVAVLLVGQRLEGRGVERLPALGQGLGDGVLGHHRLPRPGRGRHQDRPAGVEGVEGAQLERVRLEPQPAEELLADAHVATCGVPGR